jgi:hypothetical protein
MAPNQKRGDNGALKTPSKKKASKKGNPLKKKCEKSIFNLLLHLPSNFGKMWPTAHTLCTILLVMGGVSSLLKQLIKLS